MTLLAIQFHSWTALKWINDEQQKGVQGVWRFEVVTGGHKGLREDTRGYKGI